VKSKSGSLVITAAAFFLLLSFPCLGLAAYIKDPAFGSDGVQLVEIDNFHDRVFAAASLRNGKIVVTGTSENNAGIDIAVVRLNENGSLDTAFNADGKAVFLQGGGDDGAYDVQVKEDGTIIVAGFLRENADSPKKFALLQITSNGILDSGFGPSSSGIVTLEDGESGGEALALTFDAENRIVAGGVVFSDTRKWAIVARFLENGSLDTFFGINGIRRIEIDDDTTARFVDLQSDGKIIIGGVQENEDIKRAVLFRLNEDGSVDDTFGNEGAAYLGELLADSELNTAVILQDDSIVAAGYTTTNGTKNITTAKFTSAGQIDVSFGNSGLAVTALGQNSVAYDITAKEDRAFLVAGEGGNGSDIDIVLLDLDASGTLKESTILTGSDNVGSSRVNEDLSMSLQQNNPAPVFTDDLLVAVPKKGTPLLTDIRGEDDSGRAVLLTDEGRVLVAGFAGDGTYDEMVVVAFTNDTGVDTPGAPQPGDIPYYIGTLPVTNVTRNSAVSGGVITANTRYVCEDSDSLSEEDCRPTVVTRGVAYGIAPYPSYRVSDDSTGLADDGTVSEGGSVFPEWVENSAYNSTVVRRGQTEDGSDTGTFGSDINGITPDNVYYVRAYAVLSDDSVLYGNQMAFRTDDACFIATAAYGSALQSHIDVLRLFRDTYLKDTIAGEQFIGIYYKFSPKVAEFIGNSAFLRAVARMILFPFVVFSYFMVAFSLQMKALLLLLLGCSWYSAHFFLSRR
jgi:uncharacterized delta-60 repeat protein